MNMIWFFVCLLSNSPQLECKHLDHEIFWLFPFHHYTPHAQKLTSHLVGAPHVLTEWMSQWMNGKIWLFLEILFKIGWWHHIETNQTKAVFKRGILILFRYSYLRIWFTTISGYGPCCKFGEKNVPTVLIAHIPH